MAGAADGDLPLVRGLFPFCFAIDARMRLSLAGARWERYAPEVRAGAVFDEIFAIERPLGVTDAAGIAARSGDVFLLALRSRPAFKLRGQFVPRRGPDGSASNLFVGGPWLTRIADMHALDLELDDFPPHDPRGDFLVLLQTQESTLGDLKALTARLRSTASALEARTREMEREMELRARLEAQLRQSQKMEAVGRLAGGIAHDFNNILMAIHGYAALSLSRLSPNDPTRSWIEQIRAAADRAAGLTRQLLAFSRQQVLRPAAIDLAREIRDIEGLLRPLVGERIELSVSADPAMGFAWADANALQQIVMNLAINARDAMPDGGRIEITARVYQGTPSGSLREGGFIELAVRDTGTGMDDETKARLFEPFFTTKEVGKGTGLGLATVYGLVEQCGGMIEVESELGRGSLFRVLLPRIERDAPSGQAMPAAPAGGRGERILLVEDEPLVRRVLEQILTRAGYQVVTSGDSGEALVLAQRDRAFDALVTDVVMPGMLGPQLARKVEEACGAMPTLFMSGHTEDESLRKGALLQHQRFMPKPFAPGDLLDAVRELLAANRGMRSPAI
ncbi:MAG: ATP-binding protein [Planctomycetota bacterium]